MRIFQSSIGTRPTRYPWKILKESPPRARRFLGVLRAHSPDPRRRTRPLYAVPRRIVVGDLVPEHDRDEEIGGDTQVDADGDENFTRDSLTWRRARSNIGGGQEEPPPEPPLDAGPPWGAAA